MRCIMRDERQRTGALRDASRGGVGCAEFPLTWALSPFDGERELNRTGRAGRGWMRLRWEEFGI
jgi:hypothetical protein